MQTNLKEARTRLGLKQREIAEAIGVPERTYAAWERGERALKVSEAWTIADYLGCSLDYLAGAITWDEEEERKRLNLLVDMFERLNSAGQKKLMEYCLDLSENSKYEKGGLQDTQVSGVA